MCVFGRSIRDFIPVHPGRYLPHPVWRETLAARELALRNRHQKSCELLTEHTRCLPPLHVGDCVRVQNQSGPHPTKWDRTGVVVEVKQFDQYVIRIDGSGRVTLRNRKFLRKYTPVVERGPMINMPGSTVQPPIYKAMIQPQTTNDPPPQNIEQTDINHKTPPRIVTRIYRRSQGDKHTPQEVEPKSPKTPVVIPTQEDSKQVPTSPEIVTSDIPPVIQPSMSPATPKSQRIPLALKQLQSYNNPGREEYVVQPTPQGRITRQSHKQNKSCPEQ